MQILKGPRSRWELLVAAFLIVVLVQPGRAAPHFARSEVVFTDDDPFAVLDPQNWVNPDNMTWEDVCKFLRPNHEQLHISVRENQASQILDTPFKSI